MKYVIMADGNMKRWAPGNENPKHLIKVEGESLLERIIRQLHEQDEEAEVIITSHDEAYEFRGARRHVPLENVIEIDRFTWELIGKGVIFLYGDTFYTDSAMKKIIDMEGEDIGFALTGNEIVAVKVFDEDVMRNNIHEVRRRFLSGEMKDCRGWQLLEVTTGRTKENCLEGVDPRILPVLDVTKGFNTLRDCEEFTEATALELIRDNLRG